MDVAGFGPGRGRVARTESFPQALSENDRKMTESFGDPSGQLPLGVQTYSARAALQLCIAQL